MKNNYGNKTIINNTIVNNTVINNITNNINITQNITLISFGDENITYIVEQKRLP